MTWPMASQVQRAIPGDGFDGWQNYWNLWWLKIALVDRIQNPYVTDLLYHPTGVGLYFHTLNPFNGLATMPVQLAAGLLPAYHAVVWISWVLGGYGTYLLTLWWLRRSRAAGWQVHLPALLSGVIFTFAPFHMAHLLGHMQVMSLEWIPFYVLALLRAMERSRRGRPWLRDGLLAGFFLVLTGLCDWYFVLYLFFFTGLALLWQWGSFPRRAPALLAPAVVAGGFFAVVLSPVLLPMVQEALHYSFMVRPSSDLYILSASLMDFLVPNRLHPLWRDVAPAWIGNQIAPLSERTISLGYVPLLLAATAAMGQRRRAGFWLVVAVFFLLLAMGPALHLGNITWADVPVEAQAGQSVPGWTPFAVLNRLVPFMRISRSVSRYALMVQMAVSVLAGIGLAGWLARHSPGWGRALVGVLVAAILFEFWVAPFPMSPPDTPAFYARLAQMPDDGAVLNLPMNYDRPGYLLYQTVHGRPLTVAYISRDDPRTLTERVPVLQHFRHLGPDILDVDPARVGETVLHDLEVAWVVLDRYKMPGGDERTYTEALAGAIFAGRAPFYSDERLTVYQVMPPAAPQPYLLLGPLNWGPLQEGDAPFRALGDGPAGLMGRHLPAQASVHVRYRTLPGVGAVVYTPDETEMVARLPAAPDGAEVTIPLASTGSTGEAGVVFQAEQADAVFVEEIRLVAP